MIAVRLQAGATPSAPALLLRPWDPADGDDLVELYRDDALLRRVGMRVAASPTNQPPYC